MSFHIPVMKDVVLEFLNPEDGVFLDATIGGGGHSHLILESSDRIKLLGIDQDPEAIEFAQDRLKPFRNRCLFFCDNFINLKQILKETGTKGLSGILFDLGVSLHQITSRDRGFSYIINGPLDMRMNPKDGTPAYEIIKEASYERLKKILRDYGEEPYAAPIAKRIFENRRNIQTTGTFVEIVRQSVHRRRLKKSLSRVFQALRIEVNQELKSLSKGLKDAIESLLPKGKIVVISYHSLEDRIVKNTFRKDKEEGILRILTKKPLSPNPEEVEENLKARSAKLRAAEKV